MLAGFSPYYSKTYSYPPLWAYTYFPFLLFASFLVDPRTFATHVSQMDWVSLIVGYSPTILSPVFLFVVKLPLILADIATGYLLYKLVTRFSGTGLARKAYIFWIFNPLVIWTSAVHGAFDVIPAMFTVIALVYVLRAKYFWTGMSLSIAILYKLYPIYLIPLYGILTWTDLGRDRPMRTALPRSLRRLLTLVCGGAVPVLLSLPVVSISDILHAVFLRQGYLSSLGGISPWMIDYAPGFGWIWGIVASDIGILSVATSALAMAVSAVTGWALVRRGPVNIHGLLRSQVVGISAVFLTLVTVNPQYIVWILPFLTLATFGAGLYRRRGILLTIIAFGWQLAISGSLILLPMSYFGLPIAPLIEPVQSVLAGSAFVFNPILFLWGTVGGVITVSFLVRKEALSTNVVQRLSPSLSSSSPRRMKSARKSLKFSPSYFLVAFVIGLYAFSSIYVQASSAGRFLPANVDSTISGRTLTTHDSFLVDSGKLPLQLSLVAAPIASLEKDRPVFIYYDAGFPALGNDPRGWIGIMDHLPVELSLRGYSGQIQTVNATGLQKVMAQNFTSIVVIPSGVFPSSIQNSTQGIVYNWLKSGGVLVWMGGPFGFYSSTMASPTIDPLKANMSIALAPQEQILGRQLNTFAINGTSRMANVNTEYASALNLTYSDVWTAPTLSTLRTVGGLAVGHTQNATDNSRSSISLIPVGLGRIILFGGPVSNVLTADGEDVIAHDTAQLLSLGDLALSSEIHYSRFNLPAGTSALLTFTASFNLNSTSIQGLSLVAFSNYQFSKVYWRTQLSAV